MGENSGIEWTTHTWNPWLGCTKVSDGCKHCYAETNTKRYGQAVWGPRGTRVMTSPDYWKKPLRWEAQYVKEHAPGEPIDGEFVRVFPSQCDPFEVWDQSMGGWQLVLNAKGQTLWRDETTGEIFVFGEAKKIVPQQSQLRYLRLDHLRADMFKLIDATPHLTWMLLTKRPENVMQMWTIPQNGRDPGAPDYLRRDNVWLGTSVEDQPNADIRIEELVKCRALSPCLWVSYEPALGPLNASRWMTSSDGFVASDRGPIHGAPGIDWIVMGGESGIDARPADVSWFRDVLEYSKTIGFPVFMKQMGKSCRMNGVHVFPGDPKGGNPDEWPEDLRVREYPTIAV